MKKSAVSEMETETVEGHPFMRDSLKLGIMLRNVPEEYMGDPVFDPVCVAIGALGLVAAAFASPEWGQALLRHFDMDPAAGESIVQWSHFYEMLPMGDLR